MCDKSRKGCGRSSVPVKLVFFTLALALAGVASARDRAPKFDRDVLPILQQYCVKCHGPGQAAGKLNLSTAAHIARGGESGAAVRPGDLEESELWQRVSAGEMPPKQRMPPEQLDLLKQWISQGAQGIPDPNQAERSITDHWSFRRLEQPAAPIVQDPTNVRTVIDLFVQSSLEANGLRLGPEADRLTLIRRVSFDLTGLPPTPEEIVAFVSDSAPDAYDRMVQHYLDSPRYGEHIGKHWLDVAGYADSNGYFDSDSDRPLAYRYRDYVIRSFNRDKPFDQFIREQLAGDEIARFAPGEAATPEMIELLEATHFLRNAPDGTGESDGNPEERLRDKHAVLEAQVEILGSALFGLTLHCARCHDHKFEPVSQQDYFQLRAVLSPAFNTEDWISPQKRTVHAPLADELSRFQKDLKSGKTTADAQSGVEIAAVTDISEKVPQLFIAERGDYSKKGAAVEPLGLHALSDRDNPFVAVTPAQSGRSTGRRLAFATWLTQPQSRPAALLARLQVNRLWQRSFGVGLAQTAENLGYSGSAPSHPELLDWLAAEFVRSGWSVKAVHRLMVTSGVYRQSVELQPSATQVDPENNLLWRMPLRRLSAEQIRDALLSAGGEIDFSMGGAPVPTVRTAVGEVVVNAVAGQQRRSVYLQQRRTQIPTILRLFDAPSLVTNCIQRHSSNVPLQSLAVLNSAFVRDCAAKMARRVAHEAGTESDRRIGRAFLIAYGREPDTEEVRASLQFVKAQTQHYQGRSENPQRQAWSDFCHMLLASNEFLHLE